MMTNDYRTVSSDGDAVGDDDVMGDGDTVGDGDVMGDGDTDADAVGDADVLCRLEGGYSLKDLPSALKSTLLPFMR